MSDTKIVYRVEQEPAITAYDPAPFKKVRPGEPLQIELNLVAEQEGNFRKRAHVTPNAPNYATFSICSDEGAIPSKDAHGGEDSAPPPLSYFATGIAFCLMSHMELIIRERKLSIKSYKVEQRLVFTRGLPEDEERSGKAGASCDLLETFVIVESDEAPEDVKALVEDSQSVCMATLAVVNPTPSIAHVHLNGKGI